MDHESYLVLCDTIRYHMGLYYNEDRSEISDYEYDQLMLQLKAAEKAHPEWITSQSPSGIIGGTAKREAGVKVTHDVPMLSIEDVFDQEAVIAWVNKVHSLHPDCPFSVETKIDGLSLTLRYAGENDGKLHLRLAETRGDGLIGEDVTANAMMIPDIPKVIDLPYPSLQLRGEVYMARADFEAYNQAQEAAGQKRAANPRNLAAGSLRQLDPAVTRDRKLRFFVFNVQQGPAALTDSHCAGLNLLRQTGVPVVSHHFCLTAEAVIRAIDAIGEGRKDLPYDIDGAVVKIDPTALRPDFPAGSKYAAGHIAYKYPPEERIVVMDEILVDVGRTGKLTFTGLFHDRETGGPAPLGGTFVSRATLHNQDYMTAMSVGIGGAYKLYKSGEIIPRLNGCVTQPEKVFEAPKICPVCGEPVIREPDTADIRCVNALCPAQVVRHIAYFASLDAMNIAGLGETLAERLVKEGFVSDVSDLYRLKAHRTDLIEKGIIGREKNTDKVLAAIEDSKANDPVRLLTALGIPNVGKTTARDIMKHFPDLDALMIASQEALTAIDDVGEITAASIAGFFEHEGNRQLMAALKAYGVNMTVKGTMTDDLPLTGLTFVVTGTLPTLGRKEATELILSKGGKCTGSVSQKTDYLVAGEKAGSKLDKALALNIPVIDEAALLALCQ